MSRAAPPTLSSRTSPAAAPRRRLPLAGWLRAGGLAAAVALLASCGGSGGGDSQPDTAQGPASCGVEVHKRWLVDYMDDWYFWAAETPNVDPRGYRTPDEVFWASLFTGDRTFPEDSWSYLGSTEDYDRFYEQGRSLGYGVFLAGLEVEGQPEQPLRVRYVEPRSPAGGVIQRGDIIVSANGVAASSLIAANDYSVFSPLEAGERLTVVVQRGTVQTTVVLTASVFDLTPVSEARLLRSPNGRVVGYLALKDFISHARTPLGAAFTLFANGGARDLVIDLRYNGGGLVSVATELASYVAGNGVAGEPFATLRFNDRHASDDVSFPFTATSAPLNLRRVYVLAGERTCSASELVVNGLRPFADVVQIGGWTCGKPVGFLPVDACGTTYSAVNFESVNADNEGRYWEGLGPSCAVADDLGHALGDPAEGLTAAALSHVDTGVCPVDASRESAAQSLRHRVLRAGAPVEPGEHRGMLGR